MKKLGIAAGIAAVAALVTVMAARTGESQGTPKTVTVAIYTPTVDFASGAARLSYVQDLGKAIESQAGVKVNAQSYSSLSQLKRARPDFAILDAQCYTTNQQWKLLATAKVGGSTSRQWALYSSQGPQMTSLRGKKLAFVKMGCNDTAFLENAMLASEVSMGFFGQRVGVSNLGGAVAAVAAYKNADAVFAPTGTEKGLTKVFDTASVPNPAFVQVNKGLPNAMVNKVASAVRSFGQAGAIDGWSSPNARLYRNLRASMGKRVKRGIFSDPDPVRVDSRDVLEVPDTIDDTAVTEVIQHFEQPPERQ